MSSKPPLQGSYGFTVALVLLALCPNIIITTAIELLRPVLASWWHMSCDTLIMVDAALNSGGDRP